MENVVKQKTVKLLQNVILTEFRYVIVTLLVVETIIFLETHFIFNNLPLKTLKKCFLLNILKL